MMDCFGAVTQECDFAISQPTDWNSSSLKTLRGYERWSLPLCTALDGNLEAVFEEDGCRFRS
jgi:hypothetical protein